MKVFKSLLFTFMLTSTLFAQLMAKESLTISQCKAAGGVVISDIGNGSLRDCPGGMKLLGHISSKMYIEGALCCSANGSEPGSEWPNPCADYQCPPNMRCIAPADAPMCVKN